MTDEVRFQMNPIIHIIDKSPTYCKIIETCLHALGYSNLHLYNNSSDWIEHAAQPDIIILDNELGDNQVSGLELLRAYNTRYSGTQFIFLSSDSNLDVALSAVKSGASDYIVKSKQGLEKLVKQIDRIVHRKAEQKRRNFFLQTMVVALGMFSLIFLTAILVYTHQPI
jgi:DNA-binding NtrC family response regulator